MWQRFTSCGAALGRFLPMSISLGVFFVHVTYPHRTGKIKGQVPDPSGGFGGAGTPPEWAGSSPEHTILGVPYDEAVMNHEMRVEEDADS